MRADRLLKTLFPSLSSRQIQQALASGLVLGRHGENLKKGAKVEGLRTEGLTLHLQKLAEGNPGLRAERIAQGEDFVVIDKPAGMPSHPLGLFETHTATHWALAQFPEARGRFAAAQPELAPHRLDTGTSGVLILALTPEAHARWRARFRNKEVTKKYLAWCWGSPDPDQFEVNDRIGPVPGDPRRRQVETRDSAQASPPWGLPAASRIQVERRIEDRGVFLCQVECQTGVTHQVRVHLASRGFPLVGDRLYDPKINSRSWQPPYHQLRAVELVWGTDRFKADEKAFRAGEGLPHLPR